VSSCFYRGRGESGYTGYRERGGGDMKWH